jgi:hypothetical protein
VGYVTGGLGIAAIGVGAYFGLNAISLKNSSDRDCRGEVCSTRSGADDFDDAKTSARIADVTVAVGLVAVGVGTYLVLRPGPDDAAAAIAVSVGASPAGAMATAGASF